jgi:hypothetical protein
MPNHVPHRAGLAPLVCLQDNQTAREMTTLFYKVLALQATSTANVLSGKRGIVGANGLQFEFARTMIQWKTSTVGRRQRAHLGRDHALANCVLGRELGVLHRSANAEADGADPQIVAREGQHVEGDAQCHACRQQPGDGRGAARTDLLGQTSYGEGAGGGRDRDGHIDQDRRLACGQPEAPVMNSDWSVEIP